MKGNAVLCKYVGCHHELPTPADPSPRHLTQGLPPASHPVGGEMLASSCPKGRQHPAAEWMEVALSVDFLLLLQANRAGLTSPPFLAPPSPIPRTPMDPLQCGECLFVPALHLILFFLVTVA